MAKSTKRFFITRTAYTYNGKKRYAECYARFETMEQAQARAAELNKSDTKEEREEHWKRVVAEGKYENLTAEWLERMKQSDRESFYYTYEAKESKSK